MLGTKFHYGNCHQDYAELNHKHEKLKTQLATLRQTLRDNEFIIIELNNEINELKAIHHYERAQLEKCAQDCDKNHGNLGSQLTELQKKYKECLEEKRSCKAQLLQLQFDSTYDKKPSPEKDLPTIHIDDSEVEIINPGKATSKKKTSKNK